MLRIKRLYDALSILDDRANEIWHSDRSMGHDAWFDKHSARLERTQKAINRLRARLALERIDVTGGDRARLAAMARAV